MHFLLDLKSGGYYHFCTPYVPGISAGLFTCIVMFIPHNKYEIGIIIMILQIKKHDSEALVILHIYPIYVVSRIQTQFAQTPRSCLAKGDN